MEIFIDERDYKLLENDRYTFFVLKRIMEQECTLLLSDHESLIICYSKSPFPVWVWTPDEASEADLERAYQELRAHSFIDGKHTFNLKYQLADYIIKRAAEDGQDLTITMNMMAYDCPDPIKPDKAEGTIHQCTEEDYKALVDFIDGFHVATGVDVQERSVYEENARRFIEEGRTYLWRDANGKFVASCKYNVNDGMAGIALVYTLPEERRKHYAENLVYQVTQLAAEEGLLPMLYTNADYVASNECYKKIGYIFRGTLCTIG